MFEPNKFYKAITVTAACLLFAACGNNASTSSEVAVEAETPGPWTLAAEESGMTYITIKNGALAEINTFRTIDGKVDEDGAAEISIALDSVDTNIEIRDGRLREVLFETANFPTAKAATTLDMAQFSSLEIGASETVLLDLTIDLHGVQQQYDFYVLVTRLGANKVVVSNKAPLILSAEDFGLAEGLEQLRDLASLNEITPVVFVTTSLVFVR